MFSFGLRIEQNIKFSKSQTLVRSQKKDKIKGKVGI